MRIAMPSMPESLAYSVIAATGFIVLVAVIVLFSGDLVGCVLVLAVAAAIYWLLGRNLVTIVTAGEVAASIALLCALCALADLVVGFPYLAILFLLAAVALGFAFLLLHQGTIPIEVRFGRVIAIASPSGLIHLRMLEELRDAGVLTQDEFAAKRAALGL
jgi:putative oligomerization/nucleic acid binding protein